MQVYSWVEERLKKLPQAHGKRVLVLNLAAGGYKQPQQLFVMSYLMAAGMRFDTVLYFASAYEALTGKENGRSGLAIEYPAGVWTSVSNSLDQLVATNEFAVLGVFFLRAAQSTQRRLDQCQTAACVVVHRPLLRLERALAGALSAIGKPATDQAHFVHDPAPPAAERVSDMTSASVLSWRRSTRMMSDLAKASGGDFLGILMPTPWIHASGALPPHSTPDQVAFYAKEIPPVTIEMMRASAEMRAAGINFIDASKFFDDVAMEQVYADQGGHLNIGGLERLVANTLDVLESGRHATPPPVLQ